MELESFVTKSLVEIENGIAKANGDLRGKGSGEQFFLANGIGKDGGIEFDVAVTVSNAEAAGAGGGIQIAVVRATLGGDSRHEEERVSRIRFKVYKVQR